MLENKKSGCKLYESEILENKKVDVNYMNPKYLKTKKWM